MELRSVGTTPVRVSPIGLGTVKFGRDKGVKYPSQFVIPDDRQAKKILQTALDLGINFLDTAAAYGVSEQRLGSLLKGNRGQWVICSKAGEEFNSRTGESYFDFTPEHLRFSVERSLKRLNTEYLDIVLIHSDGRDKEIIEKLGALDVLSELKSEGKIRCAGMSTKSVQGGLLAAQFSDCVMLTLNLQDMEQLPVIEYCQQHEKGVLIKKAFSSGRVIVDQGEGRIKKTFDLILSNPGISSVVVGTINPQHLKENVALLERSLRGD